MLLKDGEYFYFDLIGACVFEGPKCLGVVQQIDRIMLDDYLLVETHDELVVDGLSRNFLIPYIKDYVEVFDMQQKMLYVKGAMDLLQSS